MVQSSWETKELVNGTLVQEFLPFLAADELMLQTQPRDRFKGGISTNSMPLNAMIHLYWSLEEQEHMFSMIRPRNQHPSPKMLLMDKTSDNTIRRQLTEFPPMLASISAAANYSEGLIKAQCSWRTEVLFSGYLFRVFLLFSPVNAWGRQTYITYRFREESRDLASFLEASNHSGREIQELFSVSSLWLCHFLTRLLKRHL